MVEYKFTVKGVFYNDKRTLCDFNDYVHDCATHPQRGAKTKRESQMFVANCARRALKRSKAQTPIHIHYDFYEVDKRRDKMNIFAFADKVTQDALQNIGFISNDGWSEVENTSHQFFIDKKNPRIEVTIAELHPEQASIESDIVALTCSIKSNAKNCTDWKDYISSVVQALSEKLEWLKAMISSSKGT